MSVANRWIIFTLRFAAYVPPEVCPGAGVTVEPSRSYRITKLPFPNRLDGKSIRVLGITLFTGTPLTFRFLNVDPVDENDDAEPLAKVFASARTASAVMVPLSKFRLATSETPVSIA